MAMNPDYSFPLCASDQADVIRIYLELLSEKMSEKMSEKNPAPHAPAVTDNRPIDSHRDFDTAWPPGELPGHDR
jgi:hypothetical protein